MLMWKENFVKLRRQILRATKATEELLYIRSLQWKMDMPYPVVLQVQWML